MQRWIGLIPKYVPQGRVAQNVPRVRSRSPVRAVEHTVVKWRDAWGVWWGAWRNGESRFRWTNRGGGGSPI